MSEDKKIKMTHNADMVATGICLNQKGWFKKSTTSRACNYLCMTLVVTAIKLVSIYVVTMKLYDQFYDPQGEIVSLTMFDKTGIEDIDGSAIDYGTLNEVAKKIYQTTSNTTYYIDKFYLEPNQAD